MLVKIRCCFLILSSSARAASAFLLSSFSSQPLESLQPNQKRQRAPFPVRLPALVRAKRLLPLFFVQLQRPGPWVISPSGYAAKNAASPARLMPVRGPQDAGQLTVATRCRALRLASAVRRFSLSKYDKPDRLPVSTIGVRWLLL